MQKIFEVTEIASLQLLHWPTVLEEIFLVPPPHLGWEPMPELRLIRDLAAVSLMPVQKVIQKLYVIIRENADIERTAEQIVDAVQRHIAPLIVNIDSNQDYLRNLGIVTAENFYSQPFYEISSHMRRSHETVMCSSDPRRAYSAAMHLRHLQYKNIYCLKLEAAN